MFKMGRNRPRVLGPRLSLGNYLMLDMPSPPASIAPVATAGPCLAEMMLNDRLGDCTSACAFHLDGAMEAAAGRPRTYPNGLVEAFYSATSGYVPGDPSTDNGADEITVLNYWHEKGLYGGTHKIGTWVTVDAANLAQLKLGIWLWGGLSLCLELPDAYVNPFPSASGFVWDVAGAPNPNNGHCIASLGYEADGRLIISTWGMTGYLTPAAAAKYCVPAVYGAAYAVLTPDFFLAGATPRKAPNGFDWSQLAADRQAIGHG
jgi:hypothetical protein